NAADLARPVYKAPPPVPVFSWTGCFVGAHGGWGWGKKEVSEVFTSSTTSSRSTTLDTSGALFGGQVGCDYQFSGNWVVGIQGDFAGTRLTALERLTADLFGNNNSTTGFYHVRTEWLASITGRLGFTGWLGPQTLIYIRGGAAWVRDKWQIDSEGAHSQFRVDFDQTRSGWTIGGGLEYAITDRWRVFGEYNHYDF